MKIRFSIKKISLTFWFSCAHRHWHQKVFIFLARVSAGKFSIFKKNHALGVVPKPLLIYKISYPLSLRLPFPAESTTPYILFHKSFNKMQIPKTSKTRLWKPSKTSVNVIDEKSLSWKQNQVNWISMRWRDTFSGYLKAPSDSKSFREESKARAILVSPMLHCKACKPLQTCNSLLLQKYGDYPTLIATQEAIPRLLIMNQGLIDVQTAMKFLRPQHFNPGHRNSCCTRPMFFWKPKRSL